MDKNVIFRWFCFLHLVHEQKLNDVKNEVVFIKLINISAKNYQHLIIIFLITIAAQQAQTLQLC